jgi:hypothetical protein
MTPRAGHARHTKRLRGSVRTWKSECRPRMQTGRRGSTAERIRVADTTAPGAVGRIAPPPRESDRRIQTPGNNDAGAVIPAGIGVCGLPGRRGITSARQSRGTQWSSSSNSSA